MTLIQEPLYLLITRIHMQIFSSEVLDLKKTMQKTLFLKIRYLQIVIIKFI